MNDPLSFPGFQCEAAPACVSQVALSPEESRLCLDGFILMAEAGCRASLESFAPLSDKNPQNHGRRSAARNREGRRGRLA
jgi:hypothetical protein